MKNARTADWLFRFVKGALIGTGFVLPGISGGALAAVFGIYERLIGFIAHITKDFWKNCLFFFPVGIGGIIGIFLISFAVSFFLENYRVPVLWFFIGCIIGTAPLLWKQGGKKGRSSKHIIILIISAAAGFLFLSYGESLFSGHITLNTLTWTLAGILIGLGTLLPGLSPSNLLVYMGMYKPMVDGFKGVDFMIIFPIAFGFAGCILGLSKIMDFFLSKAYAGLFHFILGIVLASTLMIIPRDFNYLSSGVFMCILSCIAGAVLGYWMGALEEKYK